MAVIDGTNGNDTLVGTADPDTFNPMLGKDTVDGLGGSDTLVIDYSATLEDPHAGATVREPLSSTVSSAGGSFAGVISTSYGRDKVTFSSIEHLQVTLDRFGSLLILDGSAVALGATVDLDGGPDTDTLDADLSALSTVSLHAGMATASFGSVVNFEIFRLKLTEGSDNVTVGARNDIVAGGGGSDTIDGGGGNDWLFSAARDPAYSGFGLGISYDVSSEADSLIGGAGNDSLFAGYGDTVDGGGNDFGGDKLFISFLGAPAGVTADFRLLATQTSISVGGVTITGIEETSYIEGSHFDDYLAARSVAGSPAGGSIYGRGGNDQIFASFSSGLNGSALYGGDGNDVIDASAAQFSPSSFGEAGDDHIIGGIGFERLDGGAGDDQLEGGAGNDRLIGGSGDDSYAGGGGVDTLDFGGEAGPVAVNLHSSLFLFPAGHPFGTRSLSPGEALDSEGNFESVSGIEDLILTDGNDRVLGSDGANRIEAGAGNDTLQGMGGADVLLGGDGDDSLSGGADADQLIGGAGNDLYTIASADAADQIVENAGQGTDTVVVSLADYTAPVNVENLTGANVSQTLRGNALSNVITTGSGATHVHLGSGGHDVVNGHASGFDTLHVSWGDSNRDVTMSAPLTPTPPGTSGSGVSGALSDGSVRGVAFSGIDRMNVTTGSGNDSITVGGSFPGEFRLGGGDDRLFVAGAVLGAFGGNGIDGYAVDRSASTIGEEYSLEGHSGHPFFEFEYYIDLKTGSGHDRILTGTLALDDLVSSGAGQDWILVRNGHDTVHGGADSDTLFLDWVDLEAGQGIVFDMTADGAGGWNGTFTAPDRSVTFTGIEIFALYGGAGNDSLAGGDDADTIEGAEGNDSLVGRNGIDSLVGGDGDDVIDGGLGSDSMEGGAGDDTYYSDVYREAVIEWSGQGNDTIVADVSYELPDEVENLTLAGSDVIDGHGNELDNVLTGNDSDNLLNGREGNDRMAGRGGNDGYIVEQAGDVVVEAEGGGEDGILAFVTYTLPEWVERLDLGGTAAIDATGNALANTLNGNSAANRLDGGGGADVMAGGKGDDIYIADEDDLTIENEGEGTDEIRTAAASLSLASRPNIENLTGTSSGGQILTGNGLANRIAAGSGADTLSGGGGNDVLDGGAGADSMAGGTGNDVYYVDVAGDVVEESAGGGTDEIRTSLGSYSLLGTQVEQLTATTNNAHDFRGSAGDNVVTGAAGNDLLRLNDGGDDGAFGGFGNDVIYFGSTFDAADKADGGDGRDVLILQGNYNLTLSATNLAGIESISLQSGARTTWGDTANNFYDYNLTMNDSNVGGGEQLIVNGQSLRAGEDFTFDGSAETGDGRYLVYGGHGVDTFKGGAGNDVFFFEGARFQAGDTVDGGAGRDAIVISSGSGINRFEFGDDALTSIESISLNNRFTSDPSQKPSYELVLGSGNVASGATLIVNGSSLSDRSQSVSVDGSAVEGNLILLGGFGDDTLTGGDGADRLQGGEGIDRLTGGGGADTFRYASQYDATPQLPDRILDFVSGTDKIDLSTIDADVFAAGNQALRWIGSGAFAGTGAASAGELRAYQFGNDWFVEGDMDGNGAADLVIVLTAPVAPPVQGDFVV